MHVRPRRGRLVLRRSLLRFDLLRTTSLALILMPIPVPSNALFYVQRFYNTLLVWMNIDQLRGARRQHVEQAPLDPTNTTVLVPSGAPEVPTSSCTHALAVSVQPRRDGTARVVAHEPRGRPQW